MTCYHPVLACYSKSDYAKTGQKKLHILLQSDTKEATLINSRNYPKTLYEYIYIPCRKCAGCASDKSKEWSLRAQQEIRLHEFNCFITLTYDDNSDLVMSDPMCLADLRYRHFQLFMKRLRKEFPKDKIGYMVSGEYGSLNGRAHWHAILFGFDFPDKEVVYVDSNGYKHYDSPTLRKLWSTCKRNKFGEVDYNPIGYVDLANADIDCCNYVSQYVLKKLPIGEKGLTFEGYDEETGDVYYAEYVSRTPPFVRTSKRPSIGYGWYKKFGEDSVKRGFITQLSQDKKSNKRIKTPEYYNHKFEQANPELFRNIKDQKTEKMKEYYMKNPIDRKKLETWEQSHLYRIKQAMKKSLDKIFK